MQTLNVLLALGGDMGNSIPKYGVTIAEAAVLRFIHGEQSVHNIMLVGSVTRTHRQEIGRLQKTYGKYDGERWVSKAVNALFPGAAARVFETLDELDLPEELLSPEMQRSIAAPEIVKPQTVKPEAVPQKAPEKMRKNELQSYAEAIGVDLTGVSTKADMLEAVQLHLSSQEVVESSEGDDDEDDEIEDMEDAGEDNELFR